MMMMIAVGGVGVIITITTTKICLLKTSYNLMYCFT